MSLAWSICVTFVFIISKRSTILKYYFFFNIIRAASCLWCDWYGLLICIYNKYICITIIIKTWFYNWSFKFNLIIFVIRSTCIIVHFNSIFCSKLSWFGELSNKFIFFDILLLYYAYYALFPNDFVENFWTPCNFISNFITNQITSCFCSFLNYYFVKLLICLSWCFEIVIFVWRFHV